MSGRYSFSGDWRWGARCTLTCNFSLALLTLLASGCTFDSDRTFPEDTPSSVLSVDAASDLEGPNPLDANSSDSTSSEVGVNDVALDTNQDSSIVDDTTPDASASEDIPDTSTSDGQIGDDAQSDVVTSDAADTSVADTNNQDTTTSDTSASDTSASDTAEDTPDLCQPTAALCTGGDDDCDGLDDEAVVLGDYDVTFAFGDAVTDFEVVDAEVVLVGQLYYAYVHYTGDLANDEARLVRWTPSLDGNPVAAEASGESRQCDGNPQIASSGGYLVVGCDEHISPDFGTQTNTTAYLATRDGFVLLTDTFSLTVSEDTDLVCKGAGGCGRYHLDIALGIPAAGIGDVGSTLPNNYNVYFASQTTPGSDSEVLLFHQTKSNPDGVSVEVVNRDVIGSSAAPSVQIRQSDEGRGLLVLAYYDSLVHVVALEPRAMNLEERGVRTTLALTGTACGVQFASGLAVWGGLDTKAVITLDYAVTEDDPCPDTPDTTLVVAVGNSNNLSTLDTMEASMSAVSARPSTSEIGWLGLPETTTGWRFRYEGGDDPVVRDAGDLPGDAFSDLVSTETYFAVVTPNGVMLRVDDLGCD